MKKKIPTETEVILLRWRMVRGPNILKGKIGEPPKGNIIKNQNNWVSIHSYVSCMACDETQLDSRQCSLVMMRQKKSLIFKLASPHAGGNNGNLPWVDVCLNNNCEDQDQQQQQQQFVLSPSTPSPSGSRGYFNNCDSSSSNSFHFEDKSNENGLGCPDLGWVNDLLT